MQLIFALALLMLTPAVTENLAHYKVIDRLLGAKANSDAEALKSWQVICSGYEAYVREAEKGGNLESLSCGRPTLRPKFEHAYHPHGRPQRRGGEIRPPKKEEDKFLYESRSEVVVKSEGTFYKLRDLVPSKGKDSSFEFCAAQVVNQLEPFKTQSLWGCVVWMSYLIPTQSRSLLTATDCVARDNFIGGFLANSGAVMETTRSLSHGHFTRFKTAPGEIEGQPTHVLDDARPDRPNVYPYGWTGRGFGFMARHASTMTAADSVAYNNWIGFQAMFDASLYAPRARAYNNPHYGFHAVRKGRINAVSAYAFGPYQKYGFAVDPTDSMIDVTATLTINDSRTIQPFCYWGEMAPCQNWVVPQRQSVDFNVPIFQSTTVGNLGIFWR